ncbi:MAG: gephyrin-like molybdotransferase Glp [Pseudomonadota bacterium]
MTGAVALSLEQAWLRLEEAVPRHRPESEAVAVKQACGRVLAEDVHAAIDSPPADNSAMDGFAVNVRDVRLDQSIRLSQRIAAGQAPVPLETGTAARVFTGAEIPDGANCVVIQENCEYDAQHVQIRRGLREGVNIRWRANDVKQGDRVLRQGTEIRPQEIGFLLSSGIGQIHVFKPLRVGVVATGDELVDVTELDGRQTNEMVLPPGKIIESNSPMILSTLAALGCDATAYRAPDTLDATRRVLSEAVSDNDAVLTIGGVSVGEEDHVQAALNTLGRTEFWKINIKPGKPFLFGEAEGTPVLGLPGNPVSSFVTFHLFCAPFLSKLKGADFRLPARLPAIAGFSSDKLSDRVDHLRGRIVSDYPDLVVEPSGTQSSSVQGALCAADVLIVIPANTQIKRGQSLRVIRL